MGSMPGYNFIRKAASDFGWDWGPAFAPSGISGPVYLHAYSQPFITGVCVAEGFPFRVGLFVQMGKMLEVPCVCHTWGFIDYLLLHRHIACHAW